MAILDAKIETAHRDEIRQVQLEKLQATLNRAYRHVTYYREVFDMAKLLPEDIRFLEDISRVPLTNRDDLLAHQPYGLFAVPLHDVLRLHPAAGAGGPIMVGYTRNDIGAGRRMAARALASAGVKKDDVILLLLDYAFGPAAMVTQSGADALESSLSPCAGLAPERQADIMQNYRATILAATPSQALQLGHAMQGRDAAASTLRITFIVTEVWSAELQKEIENLLQVEAFGSYGISEMTVPGTATECEQHNGLHIDEQNVIAETINPATGATLPPGEKGELVLTTLTREAVPMIRYRTGDITVLHEEECACGRTFLRMEPPSARADDVVMVNNVRVWPAQIKELVQHFLPNAQCSIQAIESEGRDELEILIGLDPTWFTDTMRDLQQLRDHIKARIFERLSMVSNIRLVEPGHLKDPNK